MIFKLIVISTLNEKCLQAGPYSWLTYEEVYETTIKIGSAIRNRGVNPVSSSPCYHNQKKYIYIQWILWIIHTFRLNCIWTLKYVSVYLGRPVWHLWCELSWVDNGYGGMHLLSALSISLRTRRIMFI